VPAEASIKRRRSINKIFIKDRKITGKKKWTLKA